MPNIDLSILNQRATPAFFADTLANRPAPSFVGRIFISTDTLDLYRDTGTAWLLLSPSSTGTITGSGAAGQVTIFSGASSITGTNNLFWDTSNLRLGINTNTPGAALDLHSTASTLMQLNQTTATNDTRIAFQNSGTALWRIGNFYNAGANDWGIFDVVGAAQPFTIKKTTGQTFIGAETTSSGRLVVNNATGDNHIVVIGATAPSIRINNAGSGATRQIGIGLATTTNNFIQGTTGGEMAIFNSNTTASPILFGIYDAGLGNTQEAARISASRNLLVGTSTDSGQKLIVIGATGTNGFIRFSDNTTSSLFLGVNSGTPYLHSNSNTLSFGANSTNNFSATMTLTNGKVGIGDTNPNAILQISGDGVSGNLLRINNTGAGTNGYLDINATDTRATISTNYSISNIPLEIKSYGNLNQLYLSTTGNVLIGTSSEGADGLGIQNQKNVSFVEGSGESYVNVFRQRNSAAGVLAQGLKRSNTGEWASSFSSSVARSAVVVGYNNGSIAFYSESATTVPNGTDISISPKMLLQNTGNLLLNTSTDNGEKLQVNGRIQATGFKSFTGTKSIASGATETIYTIGSGTGYDGLYFVQVEITTGSSIYLASGVVTALAGNNEAFFTSFYDGANVTLSVSGLNIQVTNGGFATFTWSYTILFQPF